MCGKLLLGMVGALLAACALRAEEPVRPDPGFDPALPRFDVPVESEEEYAERVTPYQREAAHLYASANETKDLAQRRAIYERLVRCYPTTVAARYARGKLGVIIFRQQGPEAALAFVQMQERLAPANCRGVEQGLAVVAGHYRKQGRYADAEWLFDRIIAGYGDSTMAIYVNDARARRYQAAGDVRREVDCLKQLVECQLVEDYEPIHLRSRAIGRLAEIYESAKLWSEAIACWEERPWAHWCGNGHFGFDSYNNARCMFCLAQLGRHAEAVERGWRNVGKPFFEQGKHTHWMLYVLYRDAGQLDDLQAILDRYDEPAFARMKDAEWYVALDPEERPKQLPMYAFRQILITGRPQPDPYDDGALLRPFPPPPRGSLPKSPGR